MRLAQSIFPRTSFDLIYARPKQTLEDWRDELLEGLWLAQGHISLYQLTIEEGTRYYDLFRAGKLKMPNEDLSADFFELTQELTKEAGLPAYEISNHARPGQESRHNLLYWRYGEYVGVGPGAHGRLLLNNHRHATATEKLPFDWQKRVETRGHGMVTDDVLTWEEEGDELLVMGLRLREGIDPARFAQLSRPQDFGAADRRAEADRLCRDAAERESAGDGQGLAGAGCGGGGSWPPECHTTKCHPGESRDPFLTSRGFKLGPGFRRDDSGGVVRCTLPIIRWRSNYTAI